MGIYQTPQVIHEATLLPSGKVVEQLCIPISHLDQSWVLHYEALLAQGGGMLDEGMPQWELRVQHKTDTLGLASIGLDGWCLASMLFLSGRNIREENALTYKLLQHMATMRVSGSIPHEPDFKLISLKQRPMLAVAMFPVSDGLASSIALDVSIFVAAAWFVSPPSS